MFITENKVNVIIPATIVTHDIIIPNGTYTPDDLVEYLNNFTE